MIRFGLCCMFKEQPIKFRMVTAAHLKSLRDPKRFISEMIGDNLFALRQALKFCFHNKIGCFRVTTNFFPMYTHPDIHYTIEELPDSDQHLADLEACKKLAQKSAIRLTFHPDPFIILNTPRVDVLRNSIAELEYLSLLSDYLGADAITIHTGGAYGDKRHAMQTFRKNFPQLSNSLKKKIAIENDDKNFTPQDLLPICEEFDIPLALDCHHHRCNPDEFTIEEATEAAIKTWNREPLFQISSPQEGWRGGHAWRHGDYINIEDFPKYWTQLKSSITVEVEAKAKEIAVLDLMHQIRLRY